MKRIKDLMVVVLVLVACIVFAADGTWTNKVNSSWATTANWQDGIVASGVGATATIASSSSITIAQNVVDLILGNIMLTGNDIHLHSNSITFDADGVSPEIYTGNYFRFRPYIKTVGYPIVKTGSDYLYVAPDNGTNTFSDGIIVKSGTLKIDSTILNAMPLGTGDIFLEGKARFYNGRDNSKYVFATGEGAKLKFSGAPVIYPKTTVFTFGSETASANSVLERVDYGALQLSTTGLGGIFKMFVNGGVEVVNGKTCLPILCGNQFVTYDETVGFTNAVETVGLNGGSTSLAAVYTNTYVTEDTSVNAVRILVSSAHRGVTVNIDPAATLTVGDGINPACVYLSYDNNFQYGYIRGGTLDFGASEGVIMFGGLSIDNSKWPTISSEIAGSGGVTYICMSDRGRFALEADTTYTGSTRIVKGIFAPGSSLTRVFSDDDVYIYGNEDIGGQLQFGYFTGNITNTFHVAGVGCAMQWRSSYDKPTGAITFTLANGGTVSGPVNLMDNVRFGAPGSTNNYGLISGSISGDYGVEIGYADYASDEYFGTVQLSGENTYTGETKISGGTLELLSKDSLGSGDVVVSEDLVFNFDDDVILDNTFTGDGRIIQRGSGYIRLLNGTEFTGTVVVENGRLEIGPVPGSVIVIQ